MKRLVRFDWAAKNILRNKANFDILEGFLSELIKEDIKIKKLLESEGNKETKSAKFNRVDILVENTQGELIIIEMQNESELDYLQRMLYGTSKLITEYIDEAEPYSKIKKIISVNIVYFDLGKGQDYIYKGTTKFVGIHNNDELLLNSHQKKLYATETISSVYPEYYVIKVEKFDGITKNTLDEWIYFLKNEEIKESFQAKGLKKAKKALDVLKMSEEKRQAYNRYLENLRYRASMVESTYTLGKLEGKKEVALALLDILDDETISLKTELNLQEVKNLRAHYKKE